MDDQDPMSARDERLELADARAGALSHANLPGASLFALADEAFRLLPLSGARAAGLIGAAIVEATAPDAANGAWSHAAPRIGSVLLECQRRLIEREEAEEAEEAECGAEAARPARTERARRAAFFDWSRAALAYAAERSGRSHLEMSIELDPQAGSEPTSLEGDPWGAYYRGMLVGSMASPRGLARPGLESDPLSAQNSRTRAWEAIVLDSLLPLAPIARPSRSL